MTTLYKTTAIAMGGRNGTVRSDDGLLNLQLALPKELGGTGDATNPEQLFAAGYAACFENAIIYISQTVGPKVPEKNIEVETSVGMVPNETGGFALTVEIEVAITGIDQASADSLVQAAHAACPYSNAVKGNIDVQIFVKAY